MSARGVPGYTGLYGAIAGARTQRAHEREREDVVRQRESEALRTQLQRDEDWARAQEATARTEEASLRRETARETAAQRRAEHAETAALNRWREEQQFRAAEGEANRAGRLREISERGNQRMRVVEETQNRLDGRFYDGLASREGMQSAHDTLMADLQRERMALMEAIAENRQEEVNRHNRNIERLTETGQRLRAQIATGEVEVPVYERAGGAELLQEHRADKTRMPVPLSGILPSIPATGKEQVRPIAEMVQTGTRRVPTLAATLGAATQAERVTNRNARVDEAARTQRAGLVRTEMTRARLLNPDAAARYIEGDDEEWPFIWVAPPRGR